MLTTNNPLLIFVLELLPTLPIAGAVYQRGKKGLFLGFLISIILIVILTIFLSSIPK